MIYLDSLGHLFSNRNVIELREFALKIGCNLNWNHYSRGFPHFDMFGGMGNSALFHGAKLIHDRTKWLQIVNRMQNITFNHYWHEHFAMQYMYESTGLHSQTIFRLRLDKF